jgi:hypothetical protein
MVTLIGNEARLGYGNGDGRKTRRMTLPLYDTDFVAVTEWRYRLSKEYLNG